MDSIRAWFSRKRPRSRSEAAPPAPPPAHRSRLAEAVQAEIHGPVPARHRPTRRLCDGCRKATSTPRHAIKHEHIDCLDRWFSRLRDKESIHKYGSNGFTLVHCAVQNNKPTALRWLLAHGAKVDTLSKKTQSKCPRTALHDAAWDGYNTCLDVLLDAGASQRITAPKGSTPIHWAAGRGNRESMWRLIAHGGDVDVARHDDGYTPLHEACYEKHEACIDLLLEVGARIELTCNDGNTALHIAVDENMYNVTVKLLERGADPERCNHEGETPLSYAKTNTMTSLLRDAIQARRRARMVGCIEACRPLCRDVARLIASFVE